MVLLAASLLQLIPDFPQWAATAYAVLEYVVAAILIVSLAEKIVMAIRDLRSIGGNGPVAGDP